jgi:CRP-like cAMP-binding protein
MQLAMDLASCSLFEGLSKKELKAIAADMTEVTHPAGKKLIVLGTEGVGFHVILEGEADAITPDGRAHRMKAGDHFGEMAILDHRGRSADVVTITNLKAAAIPAWGFEAFLAAHPKVAYRMLQTMSKRLREERTAH